MERPVWSISIHHFRIYSKYKQHAEIINELIHFWNQSHHEENTKHVRGEKFNHTALDKT